jgi:hypothetical protein
MGTEEVMGKAPASSVGSDDVLQVESKWSYLLRCTGLSGELEHLKIKTRLIDPITHPSYSK